MSIPISRYYDLLRAFEEYEKRNPPTKLESEDKSMLHNVTVTKTEEKALEEYYVMRAVKNSNFAPNKTKQVFKEKECNHYPESSEIAQFLSDTGANFVSVEHNYRFEPDLPF